MGSSTALSLFTTVAGDLGSTFYSALVIILGVAVGLAGIGWAWRKFTKHTGAHKI